MPTRPGRLCPRCRAIRHTDKCGACGWSLSTWANRARGSRHKRGYDARWVRLRIRKLARDPLCEVCRVAGRTTEATQVHHLKPFNGVNDPLRLQWDNLESICGECH